MRKPGIAFLLLMFAASRIVAASAPLNVFRPDTGQKTLFEIRDISGGNVLDTVGYWITARSGDTAAYRFLHFESQRGGTGTLAWTSGRLTARSLLMSGFLDTNGIFSRLKTFPADYSQQTATNRSRSGISLRHVVDGFVFDTLLASCQYLQATDAGDNCDFFTTSGILVYSRVEGWTRYWVLPDAATLAAMGGKPVPDRVARFMPRDAVPALWPKGRFDIRGRWTQAAAVGVILPVPGR